MVNFYEKIDIVLCAKYTDFTNEIIDDYFNLPFVNNIIVSSWIGENIKYNSNRLKVVLNTPPLTPGTDNRNVQIVTGIEGIKKVTTEYSIRMRTDQKYTTSSMFNMYQFFLQNKSIDRIFVSGVYPDLLFHPRDHVFWGKTKDLFELYDIPLELNGLIDKIRVDKYDLCNYYDHFTRTETYLGTHYCSNYDSRLKIFLLYPNEYLFDGAPKWSEAYKISKELTGKIFKSFPRIGIDLIWPSKNLYSYPYEHQKKYYNECCHEDGY